MLILQVLKWDTSQDIAIDWILSGDSKTVVFLVIGAVIVAPITEELMYRVVLHKTVFQFFGLTTANIMTSLAFAISHFKYEQIPPLFFLGMILQRKLNQTQNIWYPITIHALFNGIMILFVLIWRYQSKLIGA